jgi:hypothetical protein
MLHGRLFCLAPYSLLTLHSSPSLSSVSHPLKLMLCRLKREHLLAPLNFLFCNASLLAYSLPRNLTVKASVSVVTAYYIIVSDAAVVSAFISAETETNSNCRRFLAMDVRVDSYNQPLSGTPQYFGAKLRFIFNFRMCNAPKYLVIHYLYSSVSQDFSKIINFFSLHHTHYKICIQLYKTKAVVPLS